MTKKEQIEIIMRRYSYTHEREGVVLSESWFDEVAEAILNTVADEAEKLRDYEN